MANTAGHTGEGSRALIRVPLIHAPSDMGAMAEGLEAAYVNSFGRRRWEEQLAFVDQFWHRVRLGLDGLDLDWAGVDLYQDGLPVCGKEVEIVTQAAAGGSENYRLLLDLMARGATLMGTEDPAMLLEEYREIKAALAEDSVSPGGRQHVDCDARGRERLAARDAYIGRRIGASLQPGRTAVLFLGMAHDIEPHLPDDIVVSRLDMDLSWRGDRT